MSFPLPVPPVEHREKLLARGCRQRVGRRAALCEDVKLAVEGLNWCAGFDGVEAGGAIPATAVGLVQKLVKERGVPPERETEEEAARALLRERVGYQAGPSNVATFEMSRVSLPGDISGAPRLEDVLPHSALAFLEDNFAPMLKSEAELLEMHDHGEVITPCWDVVLQRDRRKYVALVRKLMEKGLLQATVRPKEQASLFFVHKKEGTQRMIVDCRRASERFRSPPGVYLASPESLAMLEAPRRAPLDD